MAPRTGLFDRTVARPEFPLILKDENEFKEVGVMQGAQNIYALELDAFNPYRLVTSPSFANAEVMQEVCNQISKCIRVVWPNGKPKVTVDIVDSPWLNGSKNKRPDVRPAIRIGTTKGRDYGLDQILQRGFDLSKFGLGNATEGKGPLIDWEKYMQMATEAVPPTPIPVVQAIPAVVIPPTPVTAVQAVPAVVIPPPTPIQTPTEAPQQPVSPISLPDTALSMLSSLAIPALTGAFLGMTGSGSKRGDMQSPLPVKSRKLERKGDNNMSSSSPSTRKPSSRAGSKVKALSTPKPIKSTSSKAVKGKRGSKRAKEPEPEPEPESEEEEEEEEPPEPEPEDQEEEDNDDEDQEEDENDDEEDSESEQQSSSDTDEEVVEHIREEGARRRHAARDRRRNNPPIELNDEVRSDSEDVTSLSRRCRYMQGLQSEVVRKIVLLERHTNELSEVQEGLAETSDAHDDDVRALADRLERVEQLLSALLTRQSGTSTSNGSNSSRQSSGANKDSRQSNTSGTNRDARSKQQSRIGGRIR